MDEPRLPEARHCLDCRTGIAWSSDMKAPDLSSRNTLNAGRWQLIASNGHGMNGAEILLLSRRNLSLQFFLVLMLSLGTPVLAQDQAPELLAAVDHLLMASPRVVAWYESKLAHGRNPARWAEYSISASLMIVLIAMLTGITSAYALIGIAGVNAAMILFGHLMERTNPDRDRVDWMPFAGRRASGYGIGGIGYTMHDMVQLKMAVWAD